MEFELKTISPEAVNRALAKAERYRLLNEPGEAESICLDALRVEPDNNDALVTLLLALTDQFGEDVPSAFSDALQLAQRLGEDRKSTRLNSSHVEISYAVFCLKK